MASFEQRAFDGLGKALKSMGFTGESLLSSFDTDGDSVLDFNEFSQGVAKATGQRAPPQVLKAVFSILDADNDGRISYAEVLSLLGEANPNVKDAIEIIGEHTSSDPQEKSSESKGPEPVLVVKPDFEAEEGIKVGFVADRELERSWICLLYTSPSPRD